MFDIQKTSFRVAREFIYQPIYGRQHLFVETYAPFESFAVLSESQITQIHTGAHDPKQVFQCWAAITLLVEVLGYSLHTTKGAKLFLRHSQALPLALKTLANFLWRNRSVG